MGVGAADEHLTITVIERLTYQSFRERPAPPTNVNENGEGSDDETAAKNYLADRYRGSANQNIQPPQ